MSESKDNVKVVIRIRPLNERETRERAHKCIQSSAQSVSIDARPEAKHFAYDYVADEEVSQQSFFQEVGQPIVLSCLSGYNGSIFAYGQTGAGKSFTIQGPGAEELCAGSPLYGQRGLLPRCFEYLFSEMGKEEADGTEYLIRCSYLEIYQEQVIDLLGDPEQCLQLREDIKRGVYVDRLVEETVGNFMETYELLRVGAQNRHVGSTSMNKESSRSHSVFTLVVESKTEAQGLVNFKVSRFYLIDLAGSERQKATDSAGDRLKEAGMINKSLSALGNVINSLVDISEGRSRHVHYRDSKLTFLLKDSLGGNSKTCIIANVSPADSSYGETLSTLKFAARAKQIKNKAVVNEDTSGTLDLLKEQIRRLKEELGRTGTGRACSLCAEGGGDDKILQLELLLDHNIRLRQETERFLNNEILEQNGLISALKQSIGKFENKISTDKMILKFRDATIAKYQETATEDNELSNVRSENTALREQLETNPVAAKLFVENSSLKQEAQRAKLDLKEAPGTLAWRNTELNEFTAKLSEQLKQLANSQLSLKQQFKEEDLLLIKLQYGEDLNAANEALVKERERSKKKTLKYTNRIGLLEQHVRELTQNSLILQEELDSHLSTERMSFEENLLPAAGELDEMLNKVHEQQVTDSLNRLKQEENLRLEVSNLTERNERIAFENLKLYETIEEEHTKELALQKNNETLSDETMGKSREIERLRRELEPLELLKQELKYGKTKLEEKQDELTNALQETENLTESLEYVSSQNQHLNSIVSQKDQQIAALNAQAAFATEHLQMIENNSSLALALSENEQLKKALQESTSGLTENSRVLSTLTSQLETAHSQCNSAKQVISEQQSKLQTAHSALQQSKEQEQIIKEKLEYYKEENQQLLIANTEPLLKTSLEAAQAEVASLKEENNIKMGILKTANKNILFTKNEISMWKKCLDEKNTALQGLRSELREKDQELSLLHSQLDSLDDANGAIELDHMTHTLALRGEELNELKAKTSECYAQADEALEGQTREIALLHKRCGHLQSEARTAKEDYKQLCYAFREEKNQLLSRPSEISTEGLAQITDFVFSIPGVTVGPDATGLVESTIQAIAGLCKALKRAESEVAELRGKQGHKAPLAHYHALLQTSSIKPGEFLSPRDKARYGYK